MKILVLNAGSSSQKSRLYEITNSLPDLPHAPIWQADADWTKNKDRAELKITTAQSQALQEEVPADSRPIVIEHMLKTLWSGPTQVIGTVPQIAVFDTAFHSHILPESAVYPGPYEWFEQGIRRYGFHGISHQYCAHRTAQILGCDCEPFTKP